jgi:N-acetylglucosaminyldiphosphoundecaprenol N-acetyl-beta-D-mannosaminyltransferase
VLNRFEIVAPDGHPVRLALNLLYGTELIDRCAGPDFMVRVAHRAAQEGTGVYLYGSHPRVIVALRDSLMARVPTLRVVGARPSLFRPLSEEEDAALVHGINTSGAGIVFLGLGCPLQEVFAHAHKGKLRPVQICVGAAFDFLAGARRRAPIWMQRYCLEWLFRLTQEPRRLGRRYLTTNTVFLFRVFLQFAKLRQF